MVVCAWCGAESPDGTRGQSKKFCSSGCYRMSLRKAVTPTACGFCGAPLPPKTTAGNPRRYCDRKCAAKLRVQNELQARDLTSICAICGATFVGSRRNVRCCGDACRKEDNRRKARVRWDEFVASRPQTKQWSCAWCDSPIVVPISATGGRLFHDDCRVQSRRARNRIKTVQRQGVKSAARITHEEVAERDGFLCHICEQPVDMGLPRTSKMGATLDHVVPIARGGVDSLENLKLAHWVCNVRKSDKVWEAPSGASKA